MNSAIPTSRTPISTMPKQPLNSDRGGPLDGGVCISVPCAISLAAWSGSGGGHHGTAASHETLRVFVCAHQQVADNLVDLGFAQNLGDEPPAERCFCIDGFARENHCRRYAGGDDAGQGLCPTGARN